VKQISDKEIHLLIKYIRIKIILWRVAKRLSYIEGAQFLKVNPFYWDAKAPVYSYKEIPT